MGGWGIFAKNLAFLLDNSGFLCYIFSIFDPLPCGRGFGGPFLEVAIRIVWDAGYCVETEALWASPNR